ncbi:MAG: ribosome maturation factor RimP [Gaiellales bacterium]|jgi:ribosome maturation factor RimP
MDDATDIQTTVEGLVHAARPDIYVWDVTADPGRGVLRVMIDTDGGVSLDLCEEVTHLLAPLREEWALEVSSPGLDRSLTRPDHFTRSVGREAQFVLRRPVDGRDALTGVIAAADADGCMIEIDGGSHAVPYADIKKTTLTWKLVNAR